MGKDAHILVLLFLCAFLSSFPLPAGSERFTVGAAKRFDESLYVRSTSENITVAWDAVADSRLDHYELRLFNLETGSEKTFDNIKTPQYTLKLPKVGHYVVKARSCTLNKAECSVWAESINPENASVDGIKKGWWLFGFLAPPGSITY